jgi:hypothetical protein
MNTITRCVAMFTLWLVMGLGFLAEYARLKRQGRTLMDALRRPEGILLIASLVLPLMAIILF